MENFELTLLPIIFLFSFTGYSISALRQRILLKKIGIVMPLKENFLLYLAGLSMIITPGGLGETIKSYYLKKRFGYGISKTFPLVFVERFQDMITLVIVLSFALIFIQIHEAMILDIIVVCVIIISYIIFRAKKLFVKIINFSQKISRLRKFGDNMTESYEGFYSMTEGKTMIKCAAVGIVSWTLEAIAIYLVFLAFNIDLGFILTTIIAYASILFGGVSLLPGGVGITEISATTLLTKEGVELSLATSIIIMMRISTIWLSTTTGFIASKFFISKKQ
jgi:uncharacterized protein (TIRG00374 family)